LDCRDKIKGSILVVDDKQSWQDLLYAILKEDGHDISIAGSLSEAKKKVKCKSYDIVIIDMRLVDHSSYNIEGMRVLKEVKALDPNTKAIILTGYPDPSHKKKAINHYKADGYFEKVPKGEPMDVDAFCLMLQNLLSH
jgi:DNA-binding NtrC family response regulator